MGEPRSNFLQLTSARVMNFACFRDSGDVPIDDVTVLLAENENGKSSFLRALAWWSDDEKFDDEDLWDGADRDEVHDLVALTFKTNKEANDALKTAGINATPKTLRVIRDSNGEYRVEDAVTGAALEVTKGTTVFESAKTVLEQLLRKYSQVAAAANFADKLKEAEPATPALGDGVAEVRRDLVPALPAADQPNLEAAFANLETALTDPDKILEREDAITVIDPFLPKLVYFDETVDFVADSITYAQVAADPSAHRTMINLATLADVDLVSVDKETPHRRQNLSRTTQVTLSEEFSKYWTGDPVTLFTQFDESQMTLTIEHKGRTQRPSRRSSGLKWHLGFFVNFKAEVRGELSGAILLLDEPGLRLHVKQQPMLLRLFDDLARDGCRIIYTTHMSKMLPPEKPRSYRPIIKDKEAEDAVTVVANIMSLPSKSDVMQPVRQALGMGIADAIGLGGANVVAEGLAERYVLLAMSQFCRQTKRTSLSETTTVLPAGGSGKKMLPFAAMAVAEKGKVVILVDDDKAGRSTTQLLQKALPNAVPIARTHEQDQETEFELEDLFSREYYLGLVNDSHTDIKGSTPIDQKAVQGTEPICDTIKAHFAKIGLGDFQKLRPAMELQKRLELEAVPDEKTLDAFSSLFERLNLALS